MAVLSRAVRKKRSWSNEGEQEGKGWGFVKEKGRGDCHRVSLDTATHRRCLGGYDRCLPVLYGRRRCRRCC